MLKVKRFYYGKMISIDVDKALAEHYKYMAGYVRKHGRVDGARGFQDWLKRGE